MNKTYCGACRGERGCSDCNTAAKSAVYTGLTDFFSQKDGTGCFENTEKKQGNDSAKSRCKKLFFAVDLGTTTLAFACEDESRTVSVSYGLENPQRGTSADVIGRIDAAMHGDGERLKIEIREALAKGFLFVLDKVCEQEEKERTALQPDEVRIAVAGNTVMQHLLLGYPADGLAKAPFAPYTTQKTIVSFSELFAETKNYGDFPVWIRESEITVFPCFSAFVGGDAVAGAYALFPWSMQVQEGKGDRQERQVSLLMDLGTNGEVLLWDGERIFGTATAMGSAFEGGRFAYASDLFRLIAKALQRGIMDETGLLCEPYFTKGFEGVQQEEVREFQLAKGALRAGMELLCSRADVKLSEIEQVYIAGGIGRFCDTKDLFVTGLIPMELYGKASMVGNSCIGGLLYFLKRGEPVLKTKGIILNLAEQPEFEELYYRFMNFI